MRRIYHAVAALIALTSCERPEVTATAPVAMSATQTSTAPSRDTPDDKTAAPRPVVVPGPTTPRNPDVPLRVVSEPGDASDTVHHLMGGDDLVILPRTVQQSFETALAPQLLHDVVLVYDDEDGIRTYHVGEDQQRSVLELPPMADLLEYRWVSPDGATLAVVVRDEGSFPTLSFLRVAPDGDAKVLSTTTPKPPPMTRCAARCYVAAARFDSETEFSYVVRGGPEDPINPSSPPEFHTVSVPTH